MKTNELMLGDIILKDGKPGRVVELYGGEIADCYEPEPITPEILEANGFESHKWAEITLFTKGFDKDLCIPFYIEYGLENNTLFINEGLVPTPIKYVHQLQNALRLCNLFDEADNFKIEKGGAQ